MKGLLENALTKPSLSFNMQNVDDLFAGFAMGDFAVLHGASSILSLSSLLAVRAQLPLQLGGLGTRVVSKHTTAEGFNCFSNPNPALTLPLPVLQPDLRDAPFILHNWTQMGKNHLKHI